MKLKDVLSFLKEKKIFNNSIRKLLGITQANFSRKKNNDLYYVIKLEGEYWIVKKDYCIDKYKNELDEIFQDET